MKKALLGLLAAFGLLLIATQVDDPLSDEATKLISGFKLEKHSDAYFYLLGIGANPDEDPVSVGKAVFSRYQKEIANGDYQSDYPFSETGINSPSGSLFCSLAEDGCIAALFEADADREGLLTEHHLLLQRADAFLASQEFSTLTQPSLKEIFPPFQYVTGAVRLRLLLSVALYQQRQIQQAVNQLLGSMTEVRDMLAKQDTMIGKLVFASLVSDHLDILSIMLKRQESYNLDHAIQPLSEKEKSLDKVMSREFYMAYTMFKDMKHSGELFEEGVSYPNWYVKAIFKLNMTLNELAQQHTNAIANAQLSPAEFASQSEAVSPSNGSKIRNYVGTILNQMSGPLNDQVNRIVALNAKIAMFNELHVAEVPLEGVADPYHPEKKVAVHDDKVCLDSPFRLQENLGCLAL